MTAILSPAKQEDDNHNKDLVSKLTDRFLTDADQAQKQDNTLHEEVWNVVKKPLINLIHASFYLTVLRTYFPNDAIWKSYVKKKLTLYYRYVDNFLIIGKHFEWDEATIKVLDGYGHTIPHQRREQHRNVGSQLDDMRKKGLSFKDSEDLLKKARYSVWPEVDVSPIKTPNNRVVSLGKTIKSSIPSVDNGVISVQANHGSISYGEATQALRELHSPPDDDDRIFKGFVRKLLEQLNEASLAKSVFKSAVSMRPLEQWEKDEMSDLRKTLRSSLHGIQEILDEVLDAQ